MHPNPAFRGAERTQNLAFVKSRGFGVLSVNGPQGPLMAHIPIELADDGTWAHLHLARFNPIARTALPLDCVFVVSGPDCYVSPDFYQTPDQVPTWNYIAVHLRGTLYAEPPEALAPHLNRLSDHFESTLLPKAPWTADKMSEGTMAGMMKAILPFRLEISAIEGTWKLNQNKSVPVRQAAVAALQQLGGESAKIAAYISTKNEDTAL